MNRPSHDDLVQAQIDIFENAKLEEAAGITEESKRYLDLHERFYDLESQAVPFDRRGVWHEAYAKFNDKQEDEPVHPWLDWQALPDDSPWRRWGAGRD